MGKFTQFKVQLAQLPDGRHEQDFHIDTEFFKNMENTEVHEADVNVHMDLVKKGDLYDLTFHCKGELMIPCHRCLDPLAHEVDTTYHIMVKYGEDYNDESDDLLIIPYSNAYLNVAYMLYDTIMLTIPLRHVHPLGKCNRAMAAALSKHSAQTSDEEVAESMDAIDNESPDDMDNEG